MQIGAENRLRPFDLTSTKLIMWVIM